MDEGLPQNSINAIEQSSDGYIWIATFSGLVRFDGDEFRTFNLSNTPCLISDEFFKLFISSEDVIWLLPSTMSTVATKFKDGNCETFKIADRIGGSINFVEDHDGTIWINTENKSFRFNGSEFEEAQLVVEEEIAKRALNSKKESWFGLKNNLYRIYNGAPVLVYDSIPYENSDYIYVWDHPVKERTILLGISSGIIEYEYGDSLIQKETISLPLDHLLDLKFDNKNNQFAITANGIAQKKENNFQPFKPFGEQSDIRIKSILNDNEGNYWIGTDGDGLFRFRKKFISMIDKEVGLENEKMLSITKLDNGKMLFSTNCSGIYEWENGKASLSKVHNYLPLGCYWAIFQDSKGRIWYGAGEPYMAEGYHKPVIRFGQEQGFDGYAVFAITEDSKGLIWVASSSGIYIYDGTELIRKITEEDGLYYSDSRVMFEDDDGTMWVGTNGGLNIVNENEVTKIPLIKELNSELADQPYVRAIHKDEDGFYWIGTYGDGLFRIKNGEVFRFTTEHGLFDNISSHIIEDDQGYFWMGSNRGIHRANRESLNKVADGELNRVISYSYGSIDGMNSPETNGGFQPSFIVEENGDFLLPTVAGVAKVSVGDVTVNTVPPPVYIEQIRTSEGEINKEEKIILPYDDAFLEINYTAINFTDPGKVKFQYRLEGLNNNWIEAGSRREAIYSKIPPGEYTFQVKAANNDGVWNNEGAYVSISVIPPFWQKTWFIIVSIFGLTGGMGFVVWNRTKRLKREAERQRKFTERLIESQENERKRIATELHDGLGQQILVIKNRVELARLRFKENTELSEQLEEIQNSALQSIEDVRTISHDLRPVLLERFGLTDAIINLCEEVEKASSFEWSYHVDDIDAVFPKKKEINFYRILQEACNNMLKHSKASQASLTIKKEGVKVSVTIYDDGIGFETAQLDKQLTVGLGLTGMKERVETLHGELKINSGAGNGTTIKIQIPIDGHTG